VREFNRGWYPALVGSTELTWHELGDALWLAAAMGHPPLPETQREPPARPRPGADPPESTDLAVGQSPTVDQAQLDGPASDPVEPEVLREPAPRPTPAEPVPARRMVAVSIPGSLDYFRALRPLKRRVPDRRDDHFVLDEDATAEQAAQDGLWLPITTPDTERWLDLTIVIDIGPSMCLWEQDVKALVSDLQVFGAFRSVTQRLLSTHSSDGPVLYGGTRDSAARDPGELADYSGRRMLLVITDGIGSSWLSNTVSPLLAQWAATMPTAIINLLPQRLWEREGLGVRRAQLVVPGRVRPNRTWHTVAADDPEALPDGVLAVPVLELRPSGLNWWAKLVAGELTGPVTAPVLLADARAKSLASDTSDEPPTPRERIADFVQNATPTARRLASLLAAAPVRLDAARLIQQELVPESATSHLVEVLLGGLLRVSETPSDTSDWDNVTFDFHDGVRQELLQGATRVDTARVVHLIADHYGGEIRALNRMQDAIQEPDTTPDPSSSRDLMALEGAVMRALSGSYLSRSNRIHDILLRSTAGIPTHRSEDDVAQHESQIESRPSPKPEIGSQPSERRSPTLTDLGVTMGHPPPGLRSQLPDLERTERVPPVWGDVPPRNPLFTGREEFLVQLSQRLGAGGTTAVLPSALHGMGGIGKTQMAVEYVYRHVDDYDVVWWIQAAQVSQVRKALTELAQQLGIPGTSEMHLAVPAVREALRLGKPYKRWLLVFDSAESIDVRDFFPTNGPGQILITSTNPDWASVARPLEITVFDREESIALLRKRGPEISDEEANQLAERLGDLPLAVEQAAAWRAETGMPVSEYLRLFDEKVAEILSTSAPTSYERPVAAAWNVSFDRLAERNPAAHQLLQVCAFFAPEPISRNLFTGGIRISISPDLDIALREPMQLGRAIRDINRYSLAKIDHRNNTLQLHRLVQLVLRNRMGETTRADMRHGAHTLLANYDPKQPKSSEWWPRYQDIWPHIYSSDPFGCDEPWTRELVINMMQFLYLWGDHEEAAKLARNALERWGNSFGESDSQVLAAASYLGLYLWALGRFPEAAELNRRTLELRSQEFGEDSEETIIAELRVAVDVRTAGKFMEARELNEQIYVKAKALYGEDDPVTLQTAHDLAVSIRLTGDYQAAFDLNRLTSARRGEVLGYDSVDTLNTQSGMYMDRRELGDYTLARDEHEKILRRVKELIGEDKVDTLRRQAYLAVARRKAGDHDGALDLSKQAVELFRRRYGDDHPAAMACAVGYSIDLRHAGDLEGARLLGEQTFERYRRNLGERHPNALAAAVDLAVTLRLMGDAEAARQLNERSLERFREALGPDHPYSVVCAIDLASDLAALGEPEASLALGSETLERAQRIHRENHPTTLAANLNIALDLFTLGRNEEATDLFDDTIDRYKRTLGEGHPGVREAGERRRANCDIDPLPS
jgi:tetratricopeptide (TPR) repeat protein